MRVLHVVGAMEYGGMETFIMNLYRQIDRDEVQFDFLVHHKRRGAFEDEIETLGGKVYHTSIIDDGNFIKYRHDLRTFYQNHPEYRIVHGHLGSMAFWYLGAAKKHGVPWRILHSHVPSYVKSVKGYAKNALFKLSPLYANINFACSPEAGKYQFQNRSFEIIPNVIDVTRFRYNENVRAETRNELNINNCFVVGHVGRFFTEKNHVFLLQMFQQLRKENSNAVLMLIGGGPLFEKTKQQAKELGLENSVLFLGLQENTAPYYQAMDAFVLPSLYEGFPLTGIEAQCAGLPCLFTDRTSSNILLLPGSKKLSVENNAVADWVNALAEISRSSVNREALPPQIMEHDSRTVAEKMTALYKQLWEKDS